VAPRSTEFLARLSNFSSPTLKIHPVAHHTLMRTG